MAQGRRPPAPQPRRWRPVSSCPPLAQLRSEPAAPSICRCRCRCPRPAAKALVAGAQAPTVQEQRLRQLWDQVRWCLPQPQPPMLPAATARRKHFAASRLAALESQVRLLLLLGEQAVQVSPVTALRQPQAQARQQSQPAQVPLLEAPLALRVQEQAAVPPLVVPVLLLPWPPREGPRLLQQLPRCHRRSRACASPPPPLRPTCAC